MGEYIQILIKF